MVSAQSETLVEFEFFSDSSSDAESFGEISDGEFVAGDVEEELVGDGELITRTHTPLVGAEPPPADLTALVEAAAGAVLADTQTATDDTQSAADDTQTAADDTQTAVAE